MITWLNRRMTSGIKRHMPCHVIHISMVRCGSIFQSVIALNQSFYTKFFQFLKFINLWGHFEGLNNVPGSQN
jgi:hypothetical protein